MSGAIAERALRVLLADDEPPALRRLRRILDAQPDVAVVGECASGAETLAAVARSRPDVVLLDVQMPDGDGFAVLDALADAGADEGAPLVVLVTAYDEFAVRAFEAAALDYLVKPVRRPRLRTALDRARERIAARASLREARRDAPPRDGRPPAERILVDRGAHLDVVPVDAIDWVESADNDVVLHLGRERHRLRRTMEQVLARLPAERFARVHRGAIVNLARVRQVHPWFHGNHVVVLADGTRLTTGRAYREAFLARLDALR